jgi:N-acetyl sugar amidotransferase
MKREYQICKDCVSDSSLPEIFFDNLGVCNYCEQFKAIIKEIETSSKVNDYLNAHIQKIKSTKNKNYDVLIGVSGGVDSMFLVDFAVKKGLKVLAVNFDNGWHSEIAVSNIRKCLNKLNVDLETYVVDYDEMKGLLISYMKAGLAWIDFPTDNAINATLYKIASKHNIKYIFNGSSIRTEGKQPLEWTYSDSRQLKFINKKFGEKKIKTFPLLSPMKLIYYSIIKKIVLVRPLNYLNYDKSEAKKILIKKYGWKDYGGHHHESVFTKFAIAYWLPKKFNIDKRIITYSAQIRSGLLKRDKALSLLSLPPYDEKLMLEDKEYVLKKLNISSKEFEKIWNNKNKSLYSYPSLIHIIKRFSFLSSFVLNFIFGFKPLIGFELKKKKESQ